MTNDLGKKIESYKNIKDTLKVASDYNHPKSIFENIADNMGIVADGLFYVIKLGYSKIIEPTFRNISDDSYKTTGL